MYKRCQKKTESNKIPLTSRSNRGSDISGPNNTSLIVQRSARSSDEADAAGLRGDSYHIDENDEDAYNMARPSTSLLNSMSQKKQSTPQDKNKRSKKALYSSNAENNSFLSQAVQSSQASSNSFLSGRPTGSKVVEKSTSISTNVSAAMSFFLSTLSECGTDEIAGEGSFRLTEDQGVFTRKLDNKLKTDGTPEKFTDSLKEYLSDDEKLKKLCLLTQTSSDCDVARGPEQEPMLRLLLLVDSLQAPLLQLLIERITAIANRTDDTEQVQLIAGILRQFRCLSRVHGTQFCCKLLELIEVASVPIQKEIIFLVPDLVVEEELKDVTKLLVELLQGGSELTPFIVDSLAILPSSSDLQAQVRDEVLDRLDKYPPTFLPNLVQFLISRSRTQDMAQLVSTLRLKLPFAAARAENSSFLRTSTEKGPEETDFYIYETFEKIKASLMTSKIFTEAWLKVIAGLSAREFKPLDLMVLVVVHGCVFGRKPATLTLVKNRIRSGVLTDSMVEEAFKVLRVVANENHTEVLELSSVLLMSYESVIADVAIAMYQESFSGSGPFLQQDVISDTVMHLTTGTPIAVQNALTLLRRMRATNAEAIEAHAASFMTALHILPALDLGLARQLADLVASLVAAPSQRDSGLIEELHILIRKQMHAWQKDVQRRGVVAAVMAVKHVALQTTDPADEDRLGSNLLLNMAAGKQAENAARRGFFFDELANMLREVSARPAFLAEWADRVYSQAMEHVFASNLEFECDSFPMSLQYSIDNAGQLVFPIVSFVVKPQDDAYINAATIPAAVRLLWCAEADLQRISSMMCAAVILPDASVYDKFLTYQPAQQAMAMDCLFLCANFLIECVNALATQKTSEKLVIRLKQLIEARKLILKHVGQIPNYTPPMCQFHLPVSKPAVKRAPANGPKVRRARKRKSNGADVDQDTLDASALPGPSTAPATHMDTSVLPATSTAAPAEAMAELNVPEELSDLTAFVGSFRELHCHVYKLLRMDLKLNPTKVFKKKKMSDLIVADVSWSYRPEDKPELGPCDTLYLLQDYIMKVEQILRGRHHLSKKPSGIACETITPTKFVLSSEKLLPKLCLKLDVVSRYCKDLLESHDDVWDAPGCFPKDSGEIKMCFCALLKIIAGILAWRDLQDPAHQTVLRDILFHLSRKSASTSTQSSASLALEAARYLAGLAGVVPLLSGAVHLTRAVQSCIKYSGSKDFSLVGDLCGDLLKRPWFTVTGGTDRGQAYNQQVDTLVRMYFACSEERLAAVQRSAEVSAEEVPRLLSKDSPMTTYPALNKGNFPMLYRAMCEALVSAATEELSLKGKNDEACIAVWRDVTRTLMLLVDIAKVHSSRTNLAALLKRSQAIIQLFLAKGLPLMGTALQFKSDEVLVVLKSLQVVTRFLHSVCCHSKVTSDSVVAAQVPHIRSLCERLSLEVKGVLILNKIPLELFTISVLKNRDIQGNEIISQSSVGTSSNDDESELPADEQSDDEVPVNDDSSF